MSVPTGNRSARAILLSALVATLIAVPLPVAARGPLRSGTVPQARSVDLAAALGADGTFHGARGVEGTVDTSAWTLVSDLAAGDPPRFAPAAGDVSPSVTTPIGPWSALGSNFGALHSTVYALAVSGTNLFVGGSFTNAAGISTADYIAKWNGSVWSAMGSNGGDNGALNGPVYALAASGSNVYAGGSFTDAAQTYTADYVAMWDGSGWSALGGSGDGALNNSVDALAVSGTDLYAGGAFTNAAGIAAADYVAKWALVRKPDGRIRLGSSGAYVGDNIYNLTGASQSKTGSANSTKTITFEISVQNDGTGSADSFKLKATGAASSKFTVKYFKGATDITAAVVAGSYSTASLAPGATLTITVKVTVKSTAAVGNSVTRLVTITSVGDSTKQDAVKLVGKRS